MHFGNDLDVFSLLIGAASPHYRRIDSNSRSSFRDRRRPTRALRPNLSDPLARFSHRIGHRHNRRNSRFRRSRPNQEYRFEHNTPHTRIPCLGYWRNTYHLRRPRRPCHKIHQDLSGRIYRMNSRSLESGRRYRSSRLLTASPALFKRTLIAKPAKTNETITKLAARAGRLPLPREDASVSEARTSKISGETIIRLITVWNKNRLISASSCA